MAACKYFFTPFDSNGSGVAAEAFVPSDLERRLFGVLHRSLSVATSKYELSGRVRQAYEIGCFFVDWMREEDRINMYAFFFGKSSTFGTHFTKQNRIKIKRNSAMKDMTVVFNAGVHVPEQYLPEVAPLVNYSSYRRHY